MKSIGLIGGMSYESTVTYYNTINNHINNMLGEHHSAKILLYSVDFEEIYVNIQNKDWKKAANILIDAAVKLENGGVDFILICTNTLHMVFDIVQQSVHVPFLHIADALINSLNKDNLNNILLLGTKTTMTQPFYVDKLLQAGITVILPSDEEMIQLDNIIFNELCKGEINAESKNILISIINNAQKKGAQACVLGCTELGLIISKNDISLPVYDTAIIHSITAASMALL
ncbi:MAG TPA: aspartate/glutamate racemase family protein [Clostridia bacterium]|jgi:aspartate racemase|nr:MAG: putative amino-acid racemase [Firmicutes bacterium ADurb.Bin146]HOD92918.1 aspartate/glutamate racemase family protein [Clostridia bacterium]HQM40038.1 aspartate/glutamate racemase family protein [Clostridia bacterium]